MTLDTSLLLALNSLAGQSPLLDTVIVFLASYLPYLVVAFFVGLVLIAPRDLGERIRFLLVGIVAAIAARFVVVEGIRFFIHRPRPFDTNMLTTLLTSDNWSFPSGHASFFFALATVVYLFDKRWGIGFFIITLGMTLMRVVAGIHYPSDILGGALVGGIVALAVARGAGIKLLTK